MTPEGSETTSKKKQTVSTIFDRFAGTFKKVVIFLRFFYENLKKIKMLLNAPAKCDCAQISTYGPLLHPNQLQLHETNYTVFIQSFFRNFQNFKNLKFWAHPRGNMSRNWSQKSFRKKNLSQKKKIDKKCSTVKFQFFQNLQNFNKN